jgi:hypothetical protein
LTYEPRTPPSQYIVFMALLHTDSGRNGFHLCKPICLPMIITSRPISLTLLASSPQTPPILRRAITRKAKSIRTSVKPCRRSTWQRRSPRSHIQISHLQKCGCGCEAQIFAHRGIGKTDELRTVCCRREWILSTFNVAIYISG